MSTTFVLTSGTQRLEITTDDVAECDTLRQVLDLYSEGLNISSDANIALNGEDVDPDEYDLDDIEDGDIVSATKTAGSKG